MKPREYSIEVFMLISNNMQAEFKPQLSVIKETMITHKDIIIWWYKNITKILRMFINSKIMTQHIIGPGAILWVFVCVLFSFLKTLTYLVLITIYLIWSPWSRPAQALMRCVLEQSWNSDPVDLGCRKGPDWRRWTRPDDTILAVKLF